jgi:long-chain acyl-CoA synthetase
MIRSNPSTNGIIEPETKTLYEVFRSGLKISRDNPCLGTRNGDSYIWLTYREVEKRFENFGSGLLNVLPSIKNVGIYSINRPEWLIAEGSCNYYGMCAVPIYDTLGADVLSFVVQHAELMVVVCSSDKIDNLLNLQNSHLKLVVSMDKINDPSLKLKAQRQGIILMEMCEIESLGQKNLLPHRPPSPSDICTICYTSGTTGNPKGAMIRHINFPAVASSMIAHLKGFDFNDVHLSYLPLAHCFERCSVVSLFLIGARIGFFSGNVLQLVDDLSVLKPTFFCSVPRLYNRIYYKIKSGTVDAPGVLGALFRTAFAAKQANLEAGGGLTHWFWDRLLFKKVSAVLGGNIRFMLSGSAPLSSEVLNFLRICFSCPFVQGYGQTENAAGSVVGMPEDLSLDHVGVPLSCNIIKLVDVPDMNYLTSSNPPKGEICIKGLNVMAGYYKDPEKTKETIDDDGWLHTGDIGLINNVGNLSIIDRKKNLFKLAQGEYVAPEKLESIFSECEYIQQIFVYGDSLESELVAIVIPDFEKIRDWVKSVGGNTADPKTICSTKGIKEFLLKEILKTAKRFKLQGFEIPRNLYADSELFSVENDLLTPSFKLKRNIAKEKYKFQLSKLYAELKESSKSSAKAML